VEFRQRVARAATRHENEAHPLFAASRLPLGRDVFDEGDNRKREQDHTRSQISPIPQPIANMPFIKGHLCDIGPGPLAG
jgi:hypothetical protein